MKRDCSCKRVRHNHGTNRAYQSDGCRCRACISAHTDLCRELRRQQAERRWASVDTFVSSIGTARRLQALSADGWTLVEIGNRLDVQLDRIWKLRQPFTPTVNVTTADRVRDVYGALGLPEPSKSSARAKLIARKHGYAPSLAWDDETIDDPAAGPYTPPTRIDFTHPDLPLIAARRIHSAPVDVDEIAVERAMGGEPMKLTRRERVAAVRELHSRGMNETEIGRRLRMSGASVTAYLQRDAAA